MGCSHIFIRAVLLFLFLFPLSPHHSRAEWYVGGYGGYNFSNSLTDTTMPLLGERQAQAAFPAFNPAQGDTLTSSLETSDISLKNSAIFGGKVGYFFADEGLKWLGLELEAFTTEPTIKRQSVTTNLVATFSPRVVLPPFSVPQTISQTSTLQLDESHMRLITVAFNVVARYPGKVIQPYIGVGAGAFYFNSSGQISGRQVVPGLNAQAGIKVFLTEEWGFFVEGKYNYATINELDSTFGLSGVYSAYSGVGGIAYHF
jgi:hypothetical protein